MGTRWLATRNRILATATAAATALVFAASLTPATAHAAEPGEARSLQHDVDGLVDSIARTAAERASAEGRVLDVDAAARLLSAHPRGDVPASRPVLRSLAVLQIAGTPADIAVLRDVVAHEDEILGELAQRSIAAIRTRQRDAQREAFAERLVRPSAQTLAEARIQERTWRARGLGPAEASCAAYADQVLGGTARIDGPDAWRPEWLLSLDTEWLLDRGEAGQAITSLDPDVPLDVRIRAYEDAGRTRDAIRLYAQHAVTGEPAATQALEAYGIDVERLVLGLLHTDRVREPEAMETLVRSGNALTVSVLAERVINPPSRSDQVTAADALGRMLTQGLRTAPLPREERERAERALRTASWVAPPEVRPIVRETLLGIDAE